MNQSKVKQLRDFIESHEMRYFVQHYEWSNQTYIRKAFKLVINDNEYWIHFINSSRPEIISEKILLKTMEEAKAKAQKLRDQHREKNKEVAAKEQAVLEDVTKFLNSFDWYDYRNWRTEEITQKGKPLAEAIKRVYLAMPRREKDDEQTYISLLENYIRYGTIYTQALSFRKEHVVSVKYGENGEVKVELTNGTTIIPKSDSVINLISTIFGTRLDSWSYNDVKEPKDKYDQIETHKR
jgi:hypothetical protein